MGSPGSAPLEHPDNLISHSANLDGPWHSCTRVLCPELVSAGCSSLRFPGLGGLCACDASPTAESGPTRDAFASRTRLCAHTTKSPPVPAPLLSLRPQAGSPGDTGTKIPTTQSHLGAPWLSPPSQRPHPCSRGRSARPLPAASFPWLAPAQGSPAVQLIYERRIFQAPFPLHCCFSCCARFRPPLNNSCHAASDEKGCG